MRSKLFLPFLFVAGCNSSPIVGVRPEAPAVEYYNRPGTTPECVNHSRESVYADKIVCEWKCAYYWTHDGNIGPREVTVTFTRDGDGWRSVRDALATCAD